MKETLATNLWQSGSSEEHTHCCQKWGAKWDMGDKWWEFLCLHQWGKMSKIGIVLYKIIFDDRKGHWKWNLWCTSVKVHNVDTDQLEFSDKKELNLSI